jgi:long-chain acyl-CoA synthetase
MIEESPVARQEIDIDRIAASLPRRIHEAYGGALTKAPDSVALIDDGASWSYRELHIRVQDAADQLTSLGVRAGDRVMIVSENCSGLAVLLLSVSRIDAWAIVVNPRLSARELDLIRDHSGARRAFFTCGISKEAATHAERWGADRRSLGLLEDIGVSQLNENALTEPVEKDASKQVAVLIYTSGTTGAPKGVMLTHENLMISARITADLRKMDDRDKLYLVLPISHIVGVSLLIMTLMVGGSVRLASKYDPAALAGALTQEGITIFMGVPATYQRLLEYKAVAGIKQLERGALRLITVAGAALDLELKSRVENELDLPLLNAYGTTECAPGIASVRFDAPRADQAVGTLLPGVEARIRTLDGMPVSDGEVGELHVRGRNVMRGYYRAPDLTAKVIDSGGWFNTGDLAKFEADCLYIVGRTKELIIRSGFNVYPVDVEAVLNSHEAIVQSAVVGRAVNGNEDVVAFVQLLPGSTVTAADLMAYAASQLTAYKRPSEIRLMDSLPAASTGKILKHRLAEALTKPDKSAGTGEEPQEAKCDGAVDRRA